MSDTTKKKTVGIKERADSSHLRRGMLVDDINATYRAQELAVKLRGLDVECYVNGQDVVIPGYRDGDGVAQCIKLLNDTFS